MSPSSAASCWPAVWPSHSHFFSRCSSFSPRRPTAAIPQSSSGPWERSPAASRGQQQVVHRLMEKTSSQLQLVMSQTAREEARSQVALGANRQLAAQANQVTPLASTHLSILSWCRRSCSWGSSLVSPFLSPFRFHWIFQFLPCVTISSQYCHQTHDHHDNFFTCILIFLRVYNYDCWDSCQYLSHKTSQLHIVQMFLVVVNKTV